METINPVPKPHRDGYAADGADDPETWINAPEAQRLCGGVSAMSLHRWLADEQLGFPRPAYINGKRYFLKRDVIAWMNAQVRGAA